MNYCVLTVVYTETVSCRVSIVEFIVGNIVEFMNVTMNMTMNPTNSDKVSEYNKKKKVLTITLLRKVILFTINS